MEFFFGTQWAPLSEFAGDFCSVVLGFELAISLIMKMGILGISLFDWDRVPLNLSVVWIPSANSWLQTPARSERA
jgi:cytochrome d ubiquinol oxidase subunit I